MINDDPPDTLLCCKVVKLITRFFGNDIDIIEFCSGMKKGTDMIQPVCRYCGTPISMGMVFREQNTRRGSRVGPSSYWTPGITGCTAHAWRKLEISEFNGTAVVGEETPSHGHPGGQQ